ncbi:hypothetical protein KEM55_009099 [Ascosphaera atra]|nr:hypothetical protein KEM55_009099 [Ascosphaera atra]
MAAQAGAEAAAHALKSTAKSVFRHLEVERKFAYSARLAERFRRNDGDPPFRSLKHIQTHAFHDTYYGNIPVLMRRGIYVRQRDGEWELKKRQGGDYVDSRFEEVKGRKDVLRTLYQVANEVKRVAYKAPRHSDAKKERLLIDKEKPDLGLLPWASFQTTRAQYLADEEFTVVLDTTDFGYGVGEVELQEDVPVNPDAQPRKNSLKMRKAGERLDGRIKEFMEKYRWAFPEEKPVGKLTAYEQWKEREHRKHLSVDRD